LKAFLDIVSIVCGYFQRGASALYSIRRRIALRLDDNGGHESSSECGSARTQSQPSNVHYLMNGARLPRMRRPSTRTWPGKQTCFRYCDVVSNDASNCDRCSPPLIRNSLVAQFVARRRGCRCGSCRYSRILLSVPGFHFRAPFQKMKRLRWHPIIGALSDEFFRGRFATPLALRSPRRLHEGVPARFNHIPAQRLKCPICTTARRSLQFGSTLRGMNLPVRHVFGFRLRVRRSSVATAAPSLKLKYQSVCRWRRRYDGYEAFVGKSSAACGQRPVRLWISLARRRSRTECFTMTL